MDKNYLDFIPKHADSIDFNTGDNGEITLLVENKGFFNVIAQKLFKSPRISKISLDEMGNFIWPLIDGNRSIYDISVLVKEHFGEKAEPLYDRLVQYIRTLESHGFIILNK